MTEKYDYVVLGGGSAGCVMASRLSEDPQVSVCLIEAGGEGKNWWIRMPVGGVLAIPGRPKISNWAYHTVPQEGFNGRRGYQPRGKALGGSSAINAMLYVRGHPDDYDEWAAQGCEGWDWESVLPWFKKSEQNHQFDNDLHGQDGPLHVGKGLANNPLNEIFYRAAQDVQIPYNEDFNGEKQEGVGPYQVTQFRNNDKHGERCSAAAAYLHPVMNRPNLDVITGAHVSRILVENGAATGVKYLRKGRGNTVKAKREVILCAGAFGSPQILQLSGIGPKEELSKHGIKTLVDLPGVGENLQDHVDFILSWRSDNRFLLGLTPLGLYDMFKAAMRWRKDGGGQAATTFAETGGFLKSDPALARPDLQLHLVVGIVDDHSRKLHPYRGYSAHVCVLRPKSRGTVRLADANPKSAPLIDPQFLSEQEDADLLLKGTRIMRQIMDGPAFDKVRGKELYLDGDEDDASLMQHIRSRADTIYHPVGTCKMGTDPMSVVDHECKVHGVDRLRVVDASVMPTLIGGNTNAPTIMIAEKIADGMK